MRHAPQQPVVSGEGHVDIVVWAVPGAKRNEIAGRYGDAIRVRVAQPPEKGKANDAIAAMLTDRLDAPVELVAGATSRRKTFRTSGLSADAVRRRLGV